MVAALHQAQVYRPPLRGVVEGEPLAQSVLLLPTILLAVPVRSLAVPYRERQLAGLHERTCLLLLLLLLLVVLQSFLQLLLVCLENCQEQN